MLDAERLSAIRERWERARRCTLKQESVRELVRVDVPALLDEVERLRGELRRHADSLDDVRTMPPLMHAIGMAAVAHDLRNATET